MAEQLGSLDIVINNAVTYLDGSRPILEEADLSICARTFEVNAVGPLRVVKHGLPLLRKGGRKLIVNVSSEAGSIGGPAPISAEQAAVKVLETILKPHPLDEPTYLDPDGKPLPW